MPMPLRLRRYLLRRAMAGVHPQSHRRLNRPDAREMERCRKRNILKSKSRRNKRSPLLKLPAELRNHIYEYALAAEHPIEITQDLKPPGLLSVCRQVRSETLKLWYSVNGFELNIRNFDTTMGHRWARSAQRLGISDIVWSRLLAKVLMSHDWANLMAWARVIHATVNASDSVSFTIHRHHVQSPQTDVLYGALRMAETLGRGLVAWDVCEEELEEYRFVVSQLDARWAKE